MPMDEGQINGTGLPVPHVFGPKKKAETRGLDLIRIAQAEALRAVALVVPSRLEAQYGMDARHTKKYNGGMASLLEDAFPGIIPPHALERLRGGTSLPKADFNLAFEGWWQEMAQLHPDFISGYISADQELSTLYGQTFNTTHEFTIRFAAHRGLKGPEHEQRPSWWAITKAEVILRTLNFNASNPKEEALTCCLSGQPIALAVSRHVAKALMEEAIIYWNTHDPHPQDGTEGNPFFWNNPIPDEILQAMHERVERLDVDSQKKRALHKQIYNLSHHDFNVIFENPKDIDFDHMGAMAHARVYAGRALPEDNLCLDNSYRWSDIRDVLKKEARDLAQALFAEGKTFAEVQSHIYAEFKPRLRWLYNQPEHVGIALKSENNKDSDIGQKERQALGPEHLERVWQGEWQRLQECKPPLW